MQQSLYSVKLYDDMIKKGNLVSNWTQTDVLGITHVFIKSF